MQRLVDLIAELRKNDPTWPASVQRYRHYKRAQHKLYRLRYGR